jgi:hypothetical protein
MRRLIITYKELRISIHKKEIMERNEYEKNDSDHWARLGFSQCK